MTSSSSSSESSSSSSELSFEAKKDQAASYRFSGYQLPMIQLDSTGPAYVQLQPHPYFSTQPTYWEKPAFRGIMPIKSEIIGGQSHIQPKGDSYPENPLPKSSPNGDGMIQMLPL